MSYKELRKKISSVLVVALLFGMLAPAMALGAEAVKLKDIADSYAKTEIQALVDAGIVSGYEDGSFQPTKAMTRAELAKIIVLALGKKENADKAASFADVSKDSWYRGYVGALVESGITDGTSATTFSPDANVTREELVVFFVRAMGLEETAKKVAADAKLSDLAQVSSWAKAHVSLAFKMGFVQGIENSNGTLSFNPKANAERQALARLAYEFKTNKTKFVDKAQAIAKAEEKPSTGGSTGTGSTGGGGSYGGGGGYSGGGSNNASVADRLKAGETISGNVTLGAGDFGPEDGKTAKITGTLTLDPGATGSVTLKNIEAANVEVASGASESIHFANIKITTNLTVRASNQTVSVRIVAEGNTSIKATNVTSQAIIKNATSNRDAFGGITVNPSTPGQQISVEGSIGSITVNGRITLNAAAGSDIGSISLNSANANLSLSGAGTIRSVIAAVAGAALNILDNVNLQSIQIKAKLKLEGDNTKNRIMDIPIDAPSGNLSDLIDSAIGGILDAVKIAIAKNDLKITYATGETSGNVASNLKLPLTGSNGATVVWNSDKPEVISNSGEVFSQLNDIEVTLTATITLDSLTTTKVFVVTVKAAKTAVKGIKGFDASYVEVYFLEPVGSVDKEDFTFDNDLVVNSAAVKQGTTDVVALQTSAQTPGKAYTLSYKGVNTGKSFTGYVPAPSNDASVTSTVYTVNGQSIGNVPFGTSVEAFKAGLTPAVGATLEVYAADQTTVKTGNVETGNVVIVTAQDTLTTSVYTITVLSGPSLSNDASVTSTVYTVNGQSIGNVPFGTSVEAFKAGLTPAVGATLEVYAADQTTVKTGNVETGNVVIVTAQDTVTTSVYTVTVLSGPSLSNDASVTSTVYTVNGQSIGNVPFGTSVEAFKAGLTPAVGATLEVYETDETTVKTGNVETGNVVIVTAQNSVTKSVYTITVSNSLSVIGAVYLYASSTGIVTGGTVTDVVYSQDNILGVNANLNGINVTTANYLVIKFSDVIADKAAQNSLSFAFGPSTVSGVTYSVYKNTVNENVYLSVELPSPLTVGYHKVDINGLKKQNGDEASTVTIYVYKE
ncbi:hypothetical protein PAESOLCIP111_03475 [Paenibacillus solanacearum]|uniref:SLH domain-containing protein n=1 Tax=Paenibacillus solanacearum TaxID=2048548 RepID=A0A916K2L0_9BACL|nr:S-layer homology domain-containing protein [Paenibacillus solanacearum]CAG7633533.1 hypothetical protein PAESOLCIP111_03475 [Paenibacillus solanacearum]